MHVWVNAVAQYIIVYTTVEPGLQAKRDVQQTSLNASEDSHWSAPLTVLFVKGVGEDVQAAVLVGHSVRSRDRVHEGHLDGFVVHLLCAQTPGRGVQLAIAPFDFLPRTNDIRTA